MNPLLKKEIRLILPAWGLTLLLAVFPSFFSPKNSDLSGFMMPLMLGILVLCASSFGREFSLGTFSSMMAQPFPRKQYWFIKVGVLVAAIFSVLLVCLLELWLFKAVIERGDVSHAVTTAGLFLLAAVAGGLWISLLVRQVIAVIWLIVLIPLLLSLPLLFLLSHFNATDQTLDMTIKTGLFIYAVAGIAGSWLIFRRAQDAPWSGGTITLPEWMSAKIALSSSAQRLRQPPLRALIRKEFHFNQVPLLGMGVLFLLHLGVVGLRFLHRNSTDAYWKDMNDALQAFAVLWVIAPLVIGGTSIAEERKLGTMESQLCLPVSSRRQFLVKLGFVVVIGGLLSSILLLGAEKLGAAVGVTPGFNITGSGAAVGAGMTAVALISFFASSLTRNFLQALPAAVGMVIGMVLVFRWFDHLSGFQTFNLQNYGPGSPRILWNPLLPDLLAAVALSITLPWLAYRNFRCLHEARRIWRRNALGLAAVLVFTMAVSFVFYQRVWENLTPLEPAHGPARLTLANPPMLHDGSGGDLLATLPNGRMWTVFVPGNGPLFQKSEPVLSVLNLMVGGAATHSRPQELAGAVNWRSIAPAVCLGRGKFGFGKFVTARNTVAIRPDGTLWVSETFSPPAGELGSLVQFGDDTNWLQVIGGPTPRSVVLLKTDGTLWNWKTDYSRVPSDEPGLRAVQPQQIGVDSDWQRLFSLYGGVGQKQNGSVWHLSENAKPGGLMVERATNLDWMVSGPARVDLNKASGNSDWLFACVRPDGTLWTSCFSVGYHYDKKESNNIRQISSDTNWVAVATSGDFPSEHRLVALRRDGTLWSWASDNDNLSASPARLGIHQDWVAVSQVPGGMVSLAADGSLWLWRDNSYFGREMSLLKPSEKPVPLGNVLAENGR